MADHIEQHRTRFVPAVIMPRGDVPRSEQIRGLMDQARGLAREQVRLLANAMADLQTLAAEIADGGDAYHAGTREAARSLAEELDSRLQTLESIVARVR